jgi:hypothetical protein
VVHTVGSSLQPGCTSVCPGLPHCPYVGLRRRSAQGICGPTAGAPPGVFILAGHAAPIPAAAEVVAPNQGEETSIMTKLTTESSAALLDGGLVARGTRASLPSVSMMAAASRRSPSSAVIHVQGGT